MTTEVLSIPVGPTTVARTGQGRAFYIVSTPAALTIRAIKPNRSGVLTFSGFGAGFKLRPVAPEDRWDNLAIECATPGTVVIVVGDDDVEIAAAVNVLGVTTTQEAPATAVTEAGSVAAANAAQTAIVAANPARRRVTISADSGNAGSVHLRRTGGAANVYELQPGVSLTLENTAGFDVRNDTGAVANIYRLEET